MAMGGVSYKGESPEVARPTAIVRLKIEDDCILCKVIEIFGWSAFCVVECKIQRYSCSGVRILIFSLQQINHCCKISN